MLEMLTKETETEAALPAISLAPSWRVEMAYLAGRETIYQGNDFLAMRRAVDEVLFADNSTLSISVTRNGKPFRHILVEKESHNG